MAVFDFRVFDADGHLLEDDDEIARHYEGEYRQNRRQRTWSIFPSLDGWARGVTIYREDGGRKYMHTDARVWGETIEMLGLEGTVLYPTAGLGFGLSTDVEFAVATATAYNNWVEENYCRRIRAFTRPGCSRSKIHRPRRRNSSAVPESVRTSRLDCSPHGWRCLARTAIHFFIRFMRRPSNWTCRSRSTAPRVGDWALIISTSSSKCTRSSTRCRSSFTSPI